MMYEVEVAFPEFAYEGVERVVWKYLDGQHHRHMDKDLLAIYKLGLHAGINNIIALHPEEPALFIQWRPNPEVEGGWILKLCRWFGSEVSSRDVVFIDPKPGRLEWNIIKEDQEAQS